MTADKGDLLALAMEMPSSLNDACRTIDLMAEEIAILQARSDLAVQNRNYWQEEAERLEDLRKAVLSIEAGMTPTERNGIALAVVQKVKEGKL